MQIKSRRPAGAVYDEFLAGGAIRIVAFGRHYYSDSQLEEDWTTTPLQAPKDGSGAVCSLTRHLPRIAEELGVSNILAPSAADFNARICTQKDLRVKIPVGPVTLLRGIRADGCLLERLQAYLVTPAGCADTTMWTPSKKKGYTGRVGTAHTGLRSIINYPQTRPDETRSVVQTLLRAVAGNNRALRKETRVHIALSIAPQEFTHPWSDRQRGKKNRNLCRQIVKEWGKECLVGDEEAGQIDVPEITKRQCLSLGVPEENVTCGVSATTFNLNGAKLLYSTRGSHPNRRNALLVVRYA
jgi:hypothetical protein